MSTHMEHATPPAAYVGANATVEQRWLIEYAPLVKRVARQLGSQANGAIALEDMEQIGLMGLLEALRRYGSPDEAFAGYAALRVRGAILDELRRHDWRPRAVRNAAHRARDCERALRRTLGRVPTAGEVSASLGVDIDEYRENVMANRAEAMASFDEMLDADWLSHDDNPERQVVLRRCLEQALTSLDEREQRVIQLYYEFDLSLREIAAVLELTEARVCQINKAALRKMRATLSDG
ncbi:RNA polymerase sigma factor FliA [Burkholderia mayonis]|uniref:Flagellar biosynthesis sigma factor n=1 Tax=Burkholderia mayonis TaxID=1385591 RepID=A0A1B4FQP4_9BURK|nr:flagellar biosynthesis sigma factor [Burkholderia mayonis]KVE56936.1 flagellar biosynthesis sigma factor [Burkholderia mayonis]